MVRNPRHLFPLPCKLRWARRKVALCCAGVIKHGGVKPNIIPAYTELEYYLRTPSRAELVLLKEKAERCFRSAAEATGCKVEA